MILSTTPYTQFGGHSIQEESWLKVLPHLQCPACDSANSELEFAKQSLQCSNCHKSFPIYFSKNNFIPWLFAEPTHSLLEWKARLNGFLHLNFIDQSRLKAALKDKRISRIGLKRINKILKAKKEQREQILEIVSPLDLEEKDFSHANATNVLNSKVPKVQGLTSYYDNIFRDWAWDNGENEQLLESVESVLGNDYFLGKILTIGAGAGRLSYDLHRKFSPEFSILLDINPILLLTASRLVQGEKISLHEFPIAPLNKDCFTKLQTCQAPETIEKNILFMFANGMNPPFHVKSFDTVLTPWLIDIAPQNLRDIIPRINQILKSGGRWLNIGSLAFLHKNQAWCYSDEEVIELLEKNGFKVTITTSMDTQYLKSPLSAHGRTEKVFNFCATKIKDVIVPSKLDYLPKWILETSTPIPKYDEYDIQASKYLLQAQVIGAINGERSIEQIGSLVAKQYSLSVNEATHAVKQIMLELYENN